MVIWCCTVKSIDKYNSIILTETQQRIEFKGEISTLWIISASSITGTWSII